MLEQALSRSIRLIFLGGVTLGMDTAVSNSGGLGTEGVDVTAAWADKVAPGRLSARLSWTHLLDGYNK